jgi:hypothetical protein
MGSGGPPRPGCTCTCRCSCRRPLGWPALGGNLTSLHGLCMRCCRVIDLEAAIGAAVFLLQQDKPRESTLVPQRQRYELRSRPVPVSVSPDVPRLRPSRDGRHGRRRELAQARRRLRERPRCRNESRNGCRQLLSSVTSFWRPQRQRIKAVLAPGEAERGAVTMDSCVEYPHAWVVRK